MEEQEHQTSGVIEQLLKKVYAAHKDSLKGVTSNLLRYKAAYNKAMDKCNQLQKNNDELTSENRKLSTAVTTKQNRDGKCCEVIRQSLDTVISSYKQMLADKDARITQLEEELKRFKENQVMGSSDINHYNKPTSVDGSKEQDPDSTVCVTPKQSKQTQPTGPSLSVLSPDEELVFDSKSDDLAKLKLNRRKSKRSRYSEDVSPDSKKPRKTSSTSQSDSKAKIGDISIERNRETEYNKPATSRKMGRASKGREVKQNKKVLVSDTCVTGLNDSLVSNGFNVKNSPQDSEVQTKCSSHDTSILVVPETLAIDMDETVTPSHVDAETCFETDGKFRPKLTDITEGCEDSLQSNSHDSHRNIKKKKDENKENVKKEKNQNIPESFRSILNSSDSNTSEGEDGHCKDLDLNCDSLAKDSDDDSFFESLPNSQTFVKSKSASIRMNHDALDFMTGNRNTCKNMQEVNALFETPESKGKQNELTDKINQNVIVRKPLSRKSKKDNLKNEEKIQTVLRRSPRKHKPIKDLNNPVRTPTTASTKVKTENMKVSPILGKGSAEVNLTVTPDQFDDNSVQHTLDNKILDEMDTIDCYNIMPVTNGNIDSNKKFQVKVKGKKKLSNCVAETGVQDSGKKTADTVNILHETLKSPSILGNVIDVNSSSSGSTGSKKDEDRCGDIESPLIIKGDKYKEYIDEDLEILDWNSVKGQKKSNAQNSLSLSTKRDSCRSSQQSGNFKRPGAVKSGKNAPRSVHQTTLTQGFFSPKKKKERDEIVKETDVTFDKTQDFVENFKHSPEFKSSMKTVSGQENQSIEGQARQKVLEEKKNRSEDINVGGRLNGSLDPSAELSEYCRDLETLPSLDTDFCEEDLQTGENSLPRTSTLAADDTQDIPCSSTSYKFLPKKHHKKDVENKENVDPTKTKVNLDDSFDRLPKKQGSDVAHVAVVRKQDERQKLQGHSCKECLQYYTSAGRSEEEIKQHMQQCSRHRAQFVPPDTPPHFWSIGFIETQDGNSTGIKKNDMPPADAGKEKDAPTYRRRKRLNKYFKSKNEGTVEDDSQDTQ